MLNCRSISTDLWVQAHKSLVYFFRGKRNVADPEDLAQETLTAVWSRADYFFEKEEDFLKVCYGFARKILQAKYRERQKHAADELSDVVEAPERSMQGLNGDEVRLFLEEVGRVAEAELQAEDLELIKISVEREHSDEPAAVRHRVRLHRARKKLAKLTGWFQ